MRCLSCCFAESLDLALIEAKFRGNSKYSMIRHRSVLQVSDEHLGAICYIFSNGTLVGWDYRKDELVATISFISSEIPTLFQKSGYLFDQFSYAIDRKMKVNIEPHGYFNIDCLILDRDDPELKLALSYGFSKSIKLEYYEAKVQKLIQEYTPLANNFASKPSGRLGLSVSELRGIVSKVLNVKSEINLTANLLYLPKYFWQHPNLEEYFIMLHKYLDIAERTDKVNQELSMLNELFVMYSSYLESHHSYVMELMIVVMIGVEIIFNFLTFFNVHI